MLFLIVVVIECVLFNLPHRSLSVPFQYQKDALFSLMQIKGFTENGTIWFNPHLGAPYGQDMRDFPAPEYTSFGILAILMLFSRNPFWLQNVFFLLTFPLSALAGFYVCRKVGLKNSLSLLVSLLFTFAPYHLARAETHLFLSNTFTIPLTFLLCRWIIMKAKIATWKFLLFGILIIGNGAYYAIFSLLFLVIALCISHTISKYIVSVLVLAFVFVIGVIPTLFYHYQSGLNPLLKRGAIEALQGGLDLKYLFIPTFAHKFISPEHAAAVNDIEHQTYLGIVGIIGMVYLFAVLFVGAKEKNTQIVAKLFLAGLLLGMMGGFGALISYAGFSSIREYSRIAIYLDFFCILSTALVLQEKKIRTMIIIVILGIGMLDQLSGFSFGTQNIKRDFESDQNFFPAIESGLPRNAMVLQLPYKQFPESAAIGDTTDYDLVRPYLHTKNIRWSYAAVKGRNTEPISDGFTGILIDRYGYVTNITSDMKVSPDGRFAYVSLLGK